MPKPFHQLTLEQFVELLDKFPFERKIESVHMHHTWRPNRSQYRGLSTIESMWAFHTTGQGWSDIAQHISIAPDGSIWTGRNWNQPPASAKGFNGNAAAGPFMFETIGDFDRGKDAF
ncbi:MAG: caspase family protein, partial [bacterium]